MPLVGHVHKIIDLTKFLKAVLMNQKLPEKSFEPVGPVQVELLTRLTPSNFNLPEIAMRQDHMSADGGFTFDHPELTGASEKQARWQLVVRKLFADPFHPLPADFGWGAPITVFDSIYRSAEFAWKDAIVKPIDIFIAFGTTPDDQAVTGPTVDQAISNLLKAMNADPKLDSRAKPVDGYSFIWSDGVNMHLSTGSGPATTISDFRLTLVSSESPNLAEFFNAYIVDFKSQHSCFVSDDHVKALLQQGVDSATSVLNATIQKTLVADLAKETGKPASTVQTFLDAFISTTFRRVRYPRFGQHAQKLPGGGTIEVTDFRIAPDPCFGFPRVLFGS